MMNSTTLCINGLVELPGSTGLARLVSVEDDGVLGVVEIVTAKNRTRRFSMPVSDLRRGFIGRQSRVSFQTDNGINMGRVIDYLEDETHRIRYVVRMRSGNEETVCETALRVRPWTEPVDPLVAMQHGMVDTPYFHERRMTFLGDMTDMRRSVQGMTALLSAKVEPAPHQIAAVRRILADPVQRYMLADEVGLGKTIEAGLVLRQHLIDNPSTRSLVAVPGHLVAQWEKELHGRLGLDQFDGAAEICAHEDLADVSGIPDILIVDEAHHLIPPVASSLEAAAAVFLPLAHKSPVLLLLSATPPTGDPQRFHALLHALDPQAHPLDAIGAFQAKLAMQNDIAPLLVRLEAGQSDFVLKGAVKGLIRLLADDAHASDLIAAGHAVLEAPAETRARLLNDLRGGIARRYRLQQRIVRARRVDLPDWMFQPRGEAGDNIAAGWAWPQGEAIADATEDWRFAILDEQNDLRQAGRRYGALLDAVARGPDALNHWGKTGDDTESAYRAQARQSLMQGIAAGGMDAMPGAVQIARTLLDTVAAANNRSPKLVVFASDSGQAEAFHAAWASATADDGVPFMLTESAQDEVVEAFLCHDGPALLVTDRTGEEGLNLAAAHAILHLDLPFDPGRLEQRIGRLDRFGRQAGPVIQRVMLPDTGPDSPWAAWLALLDEGLGVFTRSISDMLFLAEDMRDEAMALLLEGGADALRAAILDFRARVEVERDQQEQRAVIDQLAEQDAGSDALFEAMEEAEEDEAKLEKHADWWIKDTLQLSKHKSDTHFTFKHTYHSLLPSHPWCSVLDLEKPTPMTWKRRTVLNRPEIALMRPGMPFLDGLERFTRWDDRGTTYIVHRNVKNWTQDPWIGFRLCLSIEADIGFENPLYPTLRERALQRRAMQYLPPRSVIVMTGRNGRTVEDGGLYATVMSLPYVKRTRAQEKPYGDLNLGQEDRLTLLERIVDPSALARDCTQAVTQARDELRNCPETRGKIHESVARLTVDLRRHAQEGGSPQAREVEDALRALRPGLETPAVTVDAIGCYIVSKERAEDLAGG